MKGTPDGGKGIETRGTLVGRGTAGMAAGMRGIDTIDQEEIEGVGAEVQDESESEIEMSASVTATAGGATTVIVIVIVIGTGNAGEFRISLLACTRVQSKLCSSPLTPPMKTASWPERRCTLYRSTPPCSSQSDLVSTTPAAPSFSLSCRSLTSMAKNWTRVTKIVLSSA